MTQCSETHWDLLSAAQVFPGFTHQAPAVMHPRALKSSFTRILLISFENEVRKQNLVWQGNTSAFLPLGKLRGKRWKLKVHQCLPLPSGTLGQVHCFSSPPQLPPLPMHFLYMDCSTASRPPCFTPSLMLCILWTAAAAPDRLLIQTEQKLGWDHTY